MIHDKKCKVVRIRFARFNCTEKRHEKDKDKEFEKPRHMKSFLKLNIVLNIWFFFPKRLNGKTF